jgi:hypothetical protein
MSVKIIVSFLDSPYTVKIEKVEANSKYSFNKLELVIFSLMKVKFSNGATYVQKNSENVCK